MQIKLISGDTINLTEKPDTCPFCHEKTNPNVYTGDIIKDHIAEVFMSCPNKKCNRTFIAIYSYCPETVRNFKFEGLSFLQALRLKQFADIITNISPSFVSIYNQAFQAEQMQLKEICGVGYRKALEFLIKDYLITKKPEQEEKIKKEKLGNCIRDGIENSRLKRMAKLAVWLGNDETHYIRKWVDKDIHDLKNLIDITVSYLETELLADKYEAEMPN